MKIKKNGKVVTLSESDLNRIVKRYLNENEDPKQVVIDCIIENTSLKDVKNLPESCIKMVTENNLNKGMECMLAMDTNDYKIIASKIVPISKCVSKKMSGSSPMDEKLP